MVNSMEDDISNYDCFKDFKASGLVARLTDELYARTSACKEWCLATTLFLLQLTIPNCYMDTLGANTRANLMIEIIGPSRIGNKSKIMNYYILKVWKRLEGKIGHSITCPESFSVEELVTRYQKKKKITVQKQNEKTGQIENKEVDSNEYLLWGGGVFFEESSEQYKNMSSGEGYQKGLMEQLSRIYDGRLIYRATRKHQDELDREIYIPMLFASTPQAVFSVWNFKNLGERVVGQGLANRKLYIYGYEIRDKSPREYGTYSSTIDDFIETYADILYKIYLYNAIYITRPDLEKALLNAYDVDCTKLAVSIYEKNNKSLISSYIANQGLNAPKLAMLHCIGRYADMIVKYFDERLLDNDGKPMKDEHGKVLYKNFQEFHTDGNVLELALEDVNWAIGQCENFYPTFKHLIMDWKKESGESSTIKTMDAYVEKGNSLMESYPHHVVIETTFLKDMSISPKNFTEFIDFMITSGQYYKTPPPQANKKIYEKYGIVRKGGASPVLISLEPLNED